jgi:hypothetical protein
MAGRCYVELGVADRAVSLLAGVLDHYDERMTRELALYTSWLAEAQVMLGNIDEAAATATQTLDLTARVSSAHAGARASLLWQKLKPHQSTPTVAGFEEQYRSWVDARDGWQA